MTEKASDQLPYKVRPKWWQRPADGGFNLNARHGEIVENADAFSYSRALGGMLPKRDFTCDETPQVCKPFSLFDVFP
jgi:hypothetical protein